VNPQHLLEQAEQLARGGIGRPRQSDLRRAVSTTYYALFHLLTLSGAALIHRSPVLRAILARHYEHRDMKNASRGFAEGRLPGPLQQVVEGIPAELSTLADTFVELQDVRHQADYDTSSATRFRREDVLDYVARTRQAFEAWESLRGTPAGELYLIAMLFHPLVRPA
jgi:hypothetical protein